MFKCCANLTVRDAVHCMYLGKSQKADAFWRKITNS